MLSRVNRYLASLLAVQVAQGGPVAISRDAKLGAVASESDICSRIGTDLLKMGGNAADAMVGTVACVGVIGMYHSGELDVWFGRAGFQITLSFRFHMCGYYVVVVCQWVLSPVPSANRQRLQHHNAVRTETLGPVS
jgi:hypothetical protein